VNEQLFYPRLVVGLVLKYTFDVGPSYCSL